MYSPSLPKLNSSQSEIISPDQWTVTLWHRVCLKQEFITGQTVGTWCTFSQLLPYPRSSEWPISEMNWPTVSWCYTEYYEDGQLMPIIIVSVIETGIRRRDKRGSLIEFQNRNSAPRDIASQHEPMLVCSKHGINTCFSNNTLWKVASFNSTLTGFITELNICGYCYERIWSMK